MRIAQETGSFSGVPSAWDSEDYSYYSLASPEHAYADTSSGEYANLRATIGNGVSSYAYLKFDASSIPENATINSISCSVKARAYTATYVSGTVQLYTGSTAKGNAYSLSNSTNAFSLTCGSWTRSELNDIKLKFVATRITTSTSTAYGLRIYGATLTIGYTYDQTYYTATISNSSSVTVSPLGEMEYKSGDTINMTIDANQGIKVSDNGTDVTDQLVVITDQQSNISGYSNVSNTDTTKLDSLIGNGDTSTSNEGIYSSGGDGTSGSCRLLFDFSSLPDGLNVTDLYVNIKCSLENGGTSANTGFTVYLVNSSGTSISTSDSPTSTTARTLTLRLDSGKSPSDYYKNFALKMSYAYYGGIVYGATAYLVAESGLRYITQMTEDKLIHVIDYIHYLKIMGCWKKVKNVWIKNNGVWTKNNGYEFVQGKTYLRAEYLTYDSEIAYLESTGTQYIDLPLSVPAGTYMDVVFTAICLHPNNNNYGLWGTYPQNQFSSWFFSYNSETNLSLMSTMVGTQSTNGGYNLRVGKPSTVKISTTGVTEYNGTFTSLNRSLTSDVTSLRIFGVTESDNRYPIRISMFRVHVGDELVYDLIPVRIGNKGYFYDLISRVLFGNAGTGDFVLGGDKPDVAYLESTGTQYIDTGIVPDADTGILVKAMSSNSTDTYLAGLREDGNNTRWCIGHSGANTQYYYGYGNWATGGNSYTSMSVIARLNYNNTKKFAISEFDGSSQTSVSLQGLPFTPARSIYIFGANYYAESGVARWSGRIYSAQITQDNVLVRDFVPTSVNGVGYMYDKVTKQLYGNSGTGSFIIGTDRVEKPYDAEVEYIKSSGTEYIDTGYIPTVNTHIIMRAAYKGSGYTDNMNGEMESSTNKRFHWGVGGSGSFQKYHFACGSSYTNTTEDVDEYAHVFELWGNGKFKIDGRSNTIGTNESDTADDLKTTTKSITLFARNDASSVGKFINDMELYYFQIYESDALVMALIPVRIGVTSYLYDKIGNTLYGNSGTGYFAHGDDII